MITNWNSVIEGASAGLAASIILGFLILIRGYIREAILRYRIKRDFKRVGCGSGIHGLTIGIKNHAGRTFKVRELVMVDTKISFTLNPTGDVSTDFKGGDVQLTRKQKKMLKKGIIDKIPIRSVLAHTPWRTTPSPEGFVIIEPFTSHQYIMPLEMIDALSGDIQSLEIIIEYTTWSNQTRIMRISSSEMVKQIQMTIDHLKPQLESGQLDKARKMFGVPPVRKLYKNEKMPNKAQ